MNSPALTPLHSARAATGSSTGMKQRVLFSVVLAALFALPMRGGFVAMSEVMSPPWASAFSFEALWTSMTEPGNRR